MLTLVTVAPGSLAASPHLLGIGVPLASNDAYGTPGHTTLVVGAPGVFTSIVPEQGASLYIGCGTGNVKHFDGIVDEVRIYKRGLSDAEIAALTAKVK